MEVVIVEATSPSATMSKETIPSEFIQPSITIPHGASLIDVPVINFNEQDEESLVRLVMEASQDWGLFQIVNHEIPWKVIEKLQEVGKVFFELPQDEKEKYAKPVDAKSMEGYGTKLRKEGVQGWVDYLFHNIWPQNPSNYR